MADAYAAMTDNRPYRRAMDKNQALQEIKAAVGKQFDPEIAKVFFDLF